MSDSTQTNKPEIETKADRRLRLMTELLSHVDSGLTYSAAADMCGISRRTCTRWQSSKAFRDIRVGLNRPTLPTILQRAIALTMRAMERASKMINNPDTEDRHVLRALEIFSNLTIKLKEFVEFEERLTTLESAPR